MQEKRRYKIHEDGFAELHASEDVLHFFQNNDVIGKTVDADQTADLFQTADRSAGCCAPGEFHRFQHGINASEQLRKL